MSVNEKMTAIADSIRAKTGKAGKLTLDDMPSAIESIVGGGGADVSGVTATAPHVLEGDVFVDAEGNEVTGTMKNNVAETVYLTRSNSSFDIEKGYHSGGGEVRVRKSSETVTPTKEEQEVMNEADGFLSRVTVEAIPEKYQDVSGVNVLPNEVLVGSTYVDRDGEHKGTMPYNSPETYVLTPGFMMGSGYREYEIREGYHTGGGKVVVDVIGTKYVTPRVIDQIIEAPEGQFLSEVYVYAMPFTTAQVKAVLQGTTFINEKGEVTEGTMPNNGAITKSINGLTETTVDIPEGYTSGGSVNLTEDIAQALSEI